MPNKLEIHSPYPIDVEYLEQSLHRYTFVRDMFGKQPTMDEVVDRLENPKTYQDLRLIAECCHYKIGWAFYEAKKLGFDTPAMFNHSLKRDILHCPEWDEYWG